MGDVLLCECGHRQPDSARAGGRCVVKVGPPGQRHRACGLKVAAEPAVRRCACRRGIYVGGWCSFCGRADPIRDAGGLEPLVGEAPSVREQLGSGTGAPTPEKEAPDPLPDKGREGIKRGRAAPRSVGRGRPELTQAQSRAATLRRRAKDAERKRKTRSGVGRGA